MEDFDAEAPRLITAGTALTAVGIAIFAGVFSYNSLHLQSAPKRLASGNTIELQPDRIGNLITNAGGAEHAAFRRQTHVRVEPAGLPKSNRSQPQAALVLATQRQLSALKRYNGPLDGLLNKVTINAIRSYQQASGLAITGRPDRSLLEHIRFTRQITSAANFTGSTSKLPGNRDLREIQLRLAELGYQPGLADGAYGAKTRQAILQFQRDWRLPEDGLATPRLMAELAKIKGQ